MRKRLLCLLLCCLLPAAALAETFTLPIDLSGGLPVKTAFRKDLMVYEDPSIRVERGRVENKDTRFNCTYDYALITIADASQLRTVSAGGFDTVYRAKAHTMARRVNAVLALNGDFYGARYDGYVLRQGKLYRDNALPNADILLIDEDGDFHIVLAKDNSPELDKTVWNGKKIINGFAFGPALVVDDQSVLDESSSPEMSAPESRGMRICIAQTGHLQYLVVYCKAVGCNMQEMVELVQEVAGNVAGGHVIAAYNLDGGDSAQLVFLGQLINKSEKSARQVTDIIYFASAWRPED